MDDDRGTWRISWDDRKTLSDLWQDHAPLPSEGLTQRVYMALIEVAKYGYARALDDDEREGI